MTDLIAKSICFALAALFVWACCFAVYIVA